MKKTGTLLLLFWAVSCTTPGWKLVWEDNFESGTINEADWSNTARGTADWANTQSSDERCYEFRNGNLILKGIVNDDRQADTAAYLTGGIWTKDKRAIAPGRIEVRARFGSAQGAWPAIWLLPFDEKTNGWPKGGEIDIMEHLNYDDFVYQTVHSNYTYVLGHKDNPPHYGTININKDDFNVYGVDVMPDSLVFHVNGIRNCSYPRIAEADSLGQYPYFEPMYLLIDMQLGGSWVGEVNPEELPVEMEIDWVRCYEWK